MRLATSSASAQLNLGYLIAQSPGGAQRGAYRGSGFELRTDAWAVVHGAERVLLTTHARAANGSGVSSTQIDAAESLASLKAAQALDTSLLDAATAQNALSSKASREAQKAFMADIDPKEKGKYDGAVNGQEALQARAGARELDAGKPVERFAAPHVLMDAAASTNWAPPASTVLFAGQQLHWTTQGDTHMTAAYTVSSVAAEAASLYAHEGGIQAIAANGPVTLQAHTDQLEILADKEVVVVSVNDSIEIKAKQKIVLQAGQSSITLEGANITFACPGEFSVKGSQHFFDAGASKPALLPGLPTQLTTIPVTTVEKPGPHAITVMAFSAEGAALADAKVSFFDPVTKAEFAKGSISGGGESAEVSADHNRPYHALVGYDGWSAHFEEVHGQEEDEDLSFDPGELDEDRDTEHL